MLVPKLSIKRMFRFCALPLILIAQVVPSFAHGEICDIIHNDWANRPQHLTNDSLTKDRTAYAKELQLFALTSISSVREEITSNDQGSKFFSALESVEKDYLAGGAFVEVYLTLAHQMGCRAISLPAVLY